MDLLISLKTFLVDITGLERDELHFVVGLLLYSALALFLQRPLSALALVVIIALGNEVSDYVHLGEANQAELRSFLWDATTDVFWTISAPALITVTLRLLQRDQRVRVTSAR